MNLKCVSFLYLSAGEFYAIPDKKSVTDRSMSWNNYAISATGLPPSTSARAEPRSGRRRLKGRPPHKRKWAAALSKPYASDNSPRRSSPFPALPRHLYFILFYTYFAAYFRRYVSANMFPASHFRAVPRCFFGSSSQFRLISGSSSPAPALQYDPGTGASSQFRSLISGPSL